MDTATSSKTLKVITLGCRANQAESDTWTRSMASAGFRQAGEHEHADVVMVNTCVVTNAAEKQSRQFIRRMVRQHPGAQVVVTGCGAELRQKEWAQIPGVSQIISNKQKPEFLKDPQKFVSFTSTITTTSTSTLKRVRYVRANLMIQDGCKDMCTYCIIPYVRPNRVSKPIAEVLTELQALVDGGAAEIILTGINLGTYEYGLAKLLLDLQSSLRRHPSVGWDPTTSEANCNVVPPFEGDSSLRWNDGLKRLRFSSLEPAHLTSDFITQAAAFPTLCAHFHLCLQSGDDQILKAMGRGYTTADFSALLERFRSAYAAVGRTVSFSTDLIVGFPGETEAQFQNSLDFCRQINFNKIHVFPFSKRSRTPAAKMSDQVPPPLIQRRVHEALALSTELSLGFAQRYLGSCVEVLVDEKSDVEKGMTENHVKVVIQNADAHKLSLGELVLVKVLSVLADGSVAGALL